MNTETPPPPPSGLSGARVGRKMNMAGGINPVASDPQPRNWVAPLANQYLYFFFTCALEALVS